MKTIVPKPPTLDARRPSGISSPPLRAQKIKGGNLQYRALLEAAPDGMVIVNDAGEIVLLNLRAEKQFGYHRDELLGQMVKNIIPEGFAERLVADGLRSAADALAQQIGTGIELTGRRKDGSEFPIEIMLSPFESADGILVTAAIRDITVRKDSEKHLAQMEGRYRGLLEAAPDAMVVVNQAGEIVLLNLQAERQFGYRRDELVGQKVTNIIPEGFAERLIADGTRSAADALAQQIGTGIELTGRRKDRSDFPIEIMLSPLNGVDGILVTAAIRDITERKRHEYDLSRLAAVVESSHDAIIGLTSDGIVLTWNQGAERIFRYSDEEAIGQSILFLSPPDHSSGESIPPGKGAKRRGCRTPRHSSCKKGRYASPHIPYPFADQRFGWPGGRSLKRCPRRYSREKPGSDASPGAKDGGSGTTGRWRGP